MIRTFKHAGLEKFFTTGSKAGIQPAHASKLELQLDQLNEAEEISEMNEPGWKLHPLKGELAGLWSIKVNGNWRITFRFEDGDAFIVDYQDYH
jgi:proteic killer suppression protein